MKKILLCSLTALAAISVASCSKEDAKKPVVTSNQLLANTTLSGAQFFGEGNKVSYNGSLLFGSEAALTPEEKTAAIEKYKYVSGLVATQTQKTDVNLDDYKEKALSNLEALKKVLGVKELTLETLKTDYICFFVSAKDIEGKEQSFLYFYKDVTPTSTPSEGSSNPSQGGSSQGNQKPDSQKPNKPGEQGGEQDKTPSKDTEDTTKREEGSSENAEGTKESGKQEEGKADASEAESTLAQQNNQNGSNANKNTQNKGKKGQTTKDVFQLQGAALLLAEDKSITKLFHFDLKNEASSKEGEDEKESKLLLEECTVLTGEKTKNSLKMKSEVETETEEGQTSKETSYKYELLEDGQKKKEVKLSYEEEGTTQEWSVKEETATDKNKYSFKLEKKQSKEWVKVSFKANNVSKSGSFTYNATKKEYEWA